MKAMVCEAFGGPEVLALRDVPDPASPAAGEIQVRIGARGVQYVDVLMLAGKYQFRPEPPFIPGGEAAARPRCVGAIAGLSESTIRTVNDDQSRKKPVAPLTKTDRSVYFRHGTHESYF